MQWRARNSVKMQPRKVKVKIKASWGPFSRNKFGGPGEVSPVTPLSVGLDRWLSPKRRPWARHLLLYYPGTDIYYPGTDGSVQPKQTGTADTSLICTPWTDSLWTCPSWDKKSMGLFTLGHNLAEPDRLFIDSLLIVWESDSTRLALHRDPPLEQTLNQLAPLGQSVHKVISPWTSSEGVATGLVHLLLKSPSWNLKILN